MIGLILRKYYGSYIGKRASDRLNFTEILHGSYIGKRASDRFNFTEILRKLYR